MSKNLRFADLEPGGRYLHRNGLWHRTIAEINGNNVLYYDDFGPGRCTRPVFLRAVSARIRGPDPEVVCDEYSEISRKRVEPLLEALRGVGIELRFADE